MTGTATTCPACGSRQDAGTPFCAQCGTFLGWADVEAPAPPPPQAAPAPPGPAPAPSTPAPPQPVDGPPAPARGPRRNPLDETLAVLDDTRRLALDQGRSDLADRLAATRARTAGQILPVVVVGEFKRGKSTLVNALLRRAVCPVDADLVTAVPTLVRHGEEASATACYDAEASDEDTGPPPVRTRPLAMDDVAAAVSEFGEVPGGGRPSSVEVRLPHPLLRSGLALVDTPGVGGLDSAHGVLALNALHDAVGALFVTDASQEFTAPELAFLRMVLERCPATACVVTKTDLYPQWRKIVDLDREHLTRAGLDLPVFGVSSFLRLQPVQDAALTEESGFRPLARHLAGLVTAGQEQAARAAAVDVRFVTAQLGRQVEGERQVVTRPEESGRVLDRLSTARARTERLASPAAGWQQALSDRVQDLVTDVDHELQHRLRTLAREVEEVIDRGDPKDAWPDVEAWLRREVAAAVVATYDSMYERAEAVTAEMAALFDLEAGTPTGPAPAANTTPADEVDAVLGPLGPEGRLTTALAAVRTGALLPMTLAAVAGYIPGTLVAPVVVASVLAPISLLLFGAIGWKVVRDERARQLAHRRQLAKAAARRYLDEVTFRVGKECRDSLRRLQRRLRDEFQERAGAMHRSSLVTLAAAEAATTLGPHERTDRARSLAERSTELRRLSRQLSDTADADPRPVARRG